ncbi:BTB/POZ domain-containing protein 6-A [Gryllus bimaculatus]|nr:BTB/POZ domain-containing protein 6-A [Gryllus bimaculatus]
MTNTNDWQIHKKTVSQRGHHLLETALWSDCRFVVGTTTHQQVFQGHKLLLAMASPVFEAMFFGGMAEKNDPIPILDVQPDAFKAFLEYIYTDNINLESFDNACELCYVAKKYMLPHLVEECTRFLWNDLFPKNACRAYEFARLFEEPVLMEKCLKIISCETEAVLQEPSFEDVELPTLVTILELDELSIASELDLFNAVQRWAIRECTRKGLSPDDNKSLRSVLGAALGKIRFLTLTPAQFAEGPALSPLLTQDESFAVLMNISSSTPDKLPMPEGFSTCTLLRKKPAPEIPTENSVIPVQSGIFPSGEVVQEGHKYYCLRNIISQPHIFNTSILDCSVSFTVSRNICILGVQVPTQVLGENGETPSCNLIRPGQTESYSELIYSHLLDSDGSRLTYTHLTSRVNYGSLVEIVFNRKCVLGDPVLLCSGGGKVLNIPKGEGITVADMEEDEPEEVSLTGKDSARSFRYSGR